jgi:hypothetical protein
MTRGGAKLAGPLAQECATRCGAEVSEEENFCPNTGDLVGSIGGPPLASEFNRPEAKVWPNFAAANRP